MSTRYVWGKFSIAVAYEENTSTVRQTHIPIDQKTVYGSTDGVSKDTVTGKYTLINPTAINPGGVFGNFGSSAVMTYLAEFPTSTVVYAGTTYVDTSRLTGSCWHNDGVNGRDYVYLGQYFGPYTPISCAKYEFVQTNKKGTLQGYTSAAASSAYPADGVSGSYWYEYQGQDSIDARGCAIPSSIMGGSQIQISVTPSNAKVYGGTTSYIYQVKLGDGAWQTIQTTTAESINYTVPFGTTTFQARVQARDNLGFTSTDYTTSSAVTVINNQPPTAPGSIEVTGVVSGQTATITLTAATDPDGTIASYIYERSVDGQAWTQIANVNALTYQDSVSADWGTVAYRAKAVDDDGDSGPYVTSTTQVVNSGWVILAGPSPAMGEQSAPFNFQITPSISGESTADQITVSIMLDSKSIYSDSVAQGAQISVEIDTRTMTTGNHSIAVSATCAEYIPAAAEYTFSVPVVPLADGGRLDQLEAPDGQAVFPVTLARAVLGIENYGIEQKVHPGAYTGTGTFGSSNQVTLNFDFAPQLVLIQGTDGRTGILTRPSGIGASIGATESSALTVTWGDLSVSWYSALSAAVELNTADQTYSYTAFG